jgi:hypothetical protein
MKMLALSMLLIAGSGCCHTRCCKKKVVVKHSFETGVATSVYPNAPHDNHPYHCEKVDLNAKLKWEW